jgi:hypothetical protein
MAIGRLGAVLRHLRGAPAHHGAGARGGVGRDRPDPTGPRAAAGLHCAGAERAGPGPTGHRPRAGAGCHSDSQRGAWAVPGHDTGRHAGGRGRGGPLGWGVGNGRPRGEPLPSQCPRSRPSAGGRGRTPGVPASRACSGQPGAQLLLAQLPSQDTAVPPVPAHRDAADDADRRQRLRSCRSWTPLGAGGVPGPRRLPSLRSCTSPEKEFRAAHVAPKRGTGK